MDIEDGVCKTVLLIDTPASEDSFGPHTALADAISNLITEESGGVSIGIQGNWGSGKSTLVNLIIDRLSSKQPKVAPVLFDAWAHQGDPLRRSFLETLIDELDKRKWVPHKVLEGDRATLSRRKKVAHKTSNPILKPFGVVMAAGILLVPVGLALLNAALRGGLTLAWSGWQNISPMAVLGFVLAINPLLAYGAAWLNWKIKKTNGRADGEWAEVGGWNAILLRKYFTQELTETISDQDPTSVEFERIFGGLLDKGLEDPERRIVLILDNLDRVDPDDALTVLSTLQTFLQDRFSREKDWFDRLWIVIPYAPDGMNLLFESSSNSASNRRAWLGETERFLDKRLQIRFEVPPIVRSDWGEFLKDQLATAFPEHPKMDNEFHLVYRVYDLTRPDRDIPPTPRDMKLLVNQIGAFHRLWLDRFPLHHLAYYAVLSKGDKGIIGQLRDGMLPDPSVATLLGQDITDSLAALAFGVEVNKARELILLPEITESLENGNQERFEELIEQHPHAIWTVLERVPFGEWSFSETKSLVNTATVLHSLGFQDKAPAGPQETTIVSLASAFSSVNQWEPLGMHTGHGIAAMLDLNPSKNLAERVVNVIAAPIDVDESEAASEMTDQWVETLIPVLDAIHRLGLEEVLADGIPVPGNQAWILRVLSTLQSNEATRPYVLHMRSELQSEEVTNFLKQSMSSGQVAVREVKSFDALRELFPSLDWQEVGESAFQRLSAEGTYQPAEISGALSTLWELSEWEVFPRGKLEQLANSGRVLHHLHHARAQGSDEAIAWCLLTQMLMRPDPSQPPEPTGNSADGWSYFNSAVSNPADYPEAFEKFTDLVDSQDLHEIFVEVAEQVPSWRPWINAVLDELIRRGSGLMLVDSGLFVDRHAFFKGSLQEETFKSLAASLVEETDLLDDVSREIFAVESADLYIDLLQAGANKNAEFNRWVSENLKTVDDSAWETAMAQETNLLELVSERYERGGRFKLGLSYTDGLDEYARALISGQVTPQEPQKLSRLLVSVVWGDDRSALQRRLLDSAIDAEGDIAPSFFDVFGSEIADIEMIKTDSNIVRKMFEPIVREKNTSGLTWLANLFGRHSGLLDEYSPQYDVTRFEERVREVSAEELEEEQADLIRTLAEAMGFEIVETTVSEASDDTGD